MSGDGRPKLTGHLVGLLIAAASLVLIVALGQRLPALLRPVGLADLRLVILAPVAVLVLWGAERLGHFILSRMRHSSGGNGVGKDKIH